MNNEHRTILLVASRLLDYPDVGLKELLEEVEEFVQHTIASSTVKEEIRMMYRPFVTFSDIQLKELYVETFDLKTKLGLYLTAHELGDSNRRGAALIKLQKIINHAGFERVGEELADYIPMLLEFLTVAPENSEIERLKKRIGVALSYMKENLFENNPYFGVFTMLMKYVFSQPTKEELQQLEKGREEADLEELPYPIMYQ
ncbi:nitrate reductase molybdenum cofactor assembly chaperone [Bacillus andreraoultii]|uniref:nitrate reductase molybdenum cofactor assembly chaperone n=1 Tax=Bacillus andreraoultii TaxID=1499685 RepID=UPI00053AC87D|nr:nitrate reductase molybdenum cofactor assembly chaperone [Bacillus andreraoultii]